jgi:hypothetical protein
MGGFCMTKAILTLALGLLVSRTGSAAMSVAPNPMGQSAQVAAAQAAFEAELGRSLTPAEKQAFAQYAAESRPESVTRADYEKATKTVLCVMRGYNFVMSEDWGSCVHFSPFKVYTFGMVGMGYGFQVNEAIFYLRVQWDGSRYDSSFDPLPGNYGAGTSGWALGGGWFGIGADSGNKQLSGRGLNFGIGGNLATLSLLHIDE